MTPREPYIVINKRILLFPFLKILACGQNRTTSATLRHYPGLTASPSVRYILEVEGRGVLSFRLSAVDGQVLVKTRRGAHSNISLRPTDAATGPAPLCISHQG